MPVSLPLRKFRIDAQHENLQSLPMDSTEAKYHYGVIKRAIEIIDEDQSLSLDDIAARLGFSPSHLQQVFSRWRFCRKFYADKKAPIRQIQLPSQRGKLLESGLTRCAELLFSDHVCDFHTFQRCGCRMEGFEPLHLAGQFFDKPMVP